MNGLIYLQFVKLQKFCASHRSLSSAGANAASCRLSASIPAATADTKKKLSCGCWEYKKKAAPSLKVINWPKIFVVPNLTPCGANEEPRAKCLSFLVEHGVPSGTESKYFNTMAFYDHCIKLWRKQKSKQRQRRG